MKQNLFEPMEAEKTLCEKCKYFDLLKMCKESHWLAYDGYIPCGDCQQSGFTINKFRGGKHECQDSQKD